MKNLSLVSLIPLLFLEGMRAAAGEPVRWGAMGGRAAFIGAVLLAALFSRPSLINGSWLLPWVGVGVGMAGAAAAVIYWLNGSTFAAWLMLIAFFALSLDCDFALTFERSAPARWAAHSLFALFVGTTAAILTQIESHFAEEEFFIALQAIGLAIFWLLLRLAFGFIGSKFGARKILHSGIPFDLRWLAGIIILMAIAGAILAIRSYQRSFYPRQAPTFPSITAETPFLCGEVAPETQTYAGKEVFQRYLDSLAANPHKGTPEYGALALGSGASQWAQTFRDNLLAEARRGAFTGAAGSVKSVQGEAALRVYYYPRVLAAFPHLFTADDQATLREWFAAINRRAWTAEAVDWLYALAFAKLPEGPYENQENGAGLLALLEASGLADPTLSAKNRAYLTRQPRGWTARFRNIDDAAVYQLDWIENAYYQSLLLPSPILDTAHRNPTPNPSPSVFFGWGRAGEGVGGNLYHSFEWLLLQALPDGAPLRYNHPEAATLDGIGLLGAQLSNDGEYLWLAGRTLDYLSAQGKYSNAQPGVEAALNLSGSSPTFGSCLLYGDSGLPNQIGPLAPDKIVFRDGWVEDSAYLLLNLRFSGWHRYKATNTISLVYQSGALAAENLSGRPFAWLPEGRSLFRDKRIPRENLNGLLIERTGLSAILYTLTSIGGRWAQDPPAYAHVERFESGAELDYSRTVIENWRGWTHRREIYFYHHGPIVVKDTAYGPAKSKGVISWHFPASQEKTLGRWQLRGGGNPAEAAAIVSFGSIKKNTDGFWVEGEGRIEAITVFLSGEWVGAEVTSEGIRLGERFIPLERP